MTDFSKLIKNSKCKLYNKEKLTCTSLPYKVKLYQCVVLNNEIHLLGGYYYDSSTKTSTYYNSHYKWNGSSWVSVSTLPYKVSMHQCVVYNNEIHLLGGYNGSTYLDTHYKWNGKEWIKLDDLPYKVELHQCVVLNNEIHLLGGYYGSTYYDYHYKWNGSSWVSVSTLPYKVYGHRCIVYNNEIHLLGGYNNINGYNNTNTYYNSHYKWNGSSWVSVSTLPYKVEHHQCVVLNNEIHLLGGYSNSSSNDGSTYYNTHYKWNGSSWEQVSTLPYRVYGHQCVVLNNEIHLLGGGIGSTELDTHYKWNDKEWINIKTKTCTMFVPKNTSIIFNKDKTEILGNDLIKSSGKVITNSPQEINIKGDQIYTIY